MTTTANPPITVNKGESQFSIAWKQLKKNSLARFGGICLIIIYLLSLFAPFVAPDGLSSYDSTNTTRFHPPTKIHFRDPATGQFGRPFVYQHTQQLNPDTFQNEFRPSATKCPIYFGVKGDPYKLLGFIPSNIHLFGTGRSDCKVYLVGAEAMGRDLFTRIMYASQISLTIGLGATFLTFALGLLFGAMAAHFGGLVDTVIMRLIEVLASIPGLFLLILLRSIFPQEINPILALYVVLMLLAFVGWGGVARATRGLLLSVKEQDYVSAAKGLGASDSRIMVRHMLPSMITFVIASVSLAIPGSMLAEASLSFLGIGAVEPYVSWGSLLTQAQEQGFSSFTDRPWVLIPGFCIVFTVMCWQLLGDGLRDAFDPRKRR